MTNTRWDGRDLAVSSSAWGQQMLSEGESITQTSFHLILSSEEVLIILAAWVYEKATMYYLRLPERNHKFSLSYRQLPERQAADWDLAQSTNNVPGIFLNPAYLRCILA